MNERTARPRWPQKTRSNEPCSIEGCDRPRQARHLCNIHYHRVRKYGSPDNPWPVHTVCAVDECDSAPRNSRNPHCARHYDQIVRYGKIVRTGRAQPKPLAEQRVTICAEDGCDAQIRNNTKTGLCRRHARRSRPRTQVDPEQRFFQAVKPGPVPEFAPHLGPCLIYTGADNGNGYGQFRYDDRNSYAHRYAWERERGKIPDDLTVDHLCRVRRCVNADHLELVDGPTNTRRGALARQQGCKNGHEYNQENTRFRGHKRVCLICAKETGKRNAFKRTAAFTGKPNGRIRYDQELVRSVIAAVRRAETTIAQGARQIGCNPNYLGRRIWQETKADVFARDGGCVLCGSGENLDAHHRHPRGAGGSSNPAISFGMDNLVTLCRTHHNEAERNPVWSRSLGLKVYAGQEPGVIPVRTIRGLVTFDAVGGFTTAE